jgi:hypothetical protein
MSYYQGIPDEDLIEEGWTEAQLKELRKSEDSYRKKLEAKAIEEQRKFREEYNALSPNAKKAYGELCMIPFPPDIIMEHARLMGEDMDARDNARTMRILNRKWWQFWIK